MRFENIWKWPPNSLRSLLGPTRLGPGAVLASAERYGYHDEVLAVMARDKKADAGIRYVVLDSLALPTVVQPDLADVLAAIQAVVTS